MTLSWFTTIPGLLITGGVILLVIALVIFIVTSVKGKNKQVNTNESVNNGVVSANAAPTPTMDNTNVVAPTPVVPQEVVPSVDVPVVNSTTTIPEVTVTEMNETPVAEVPTMDQGVVMPQEVNTTNEMPNDVATFTVGSPMGDNFGTVPEVEVPQVSVYSEPVQEVSVPTMPVVENNNDIPVPSVEQVVPEMQDVEAPTISLNNQMPTDIPTVEMPVETPVVETPVVETPVVETSVVSEPVVEQPSIYGGASPAITSYEAPVYDHQIYGGANPLENTQSVPISDITNGLNTSASTPVVEAPVMPEVEIPQVDMTAVETPVVETPVVEQPSIELPPIDGVNNM